MNTIRLDKKAILISLLIIWCISYIILYWIPYIIEIATFVKHIKYEMLSGHTSIQFLELNIYSHFYLIIISIICISITLFLCLFSYKKIDIKFIGVGIIFQTLFSISIRIRNYYLTNNYNGIEVISLKSWVILSFSICCIICLLYCIYRKISYIILCLTTILQLLCIIMFVKSNLEFLTTESITHPSYIKIVFRCINEIFGYVVYWLLIINSVNLNKRAREINKKLKQ